MQCDEEAASEGAEEGQKHGYLRGRGAPSGGTDLLVVALGREEEEESIKKDSVITKVFLWV